MTFSLRTAISIAALSVIALSPRARSDDDVQKDLVGVQGLWESPARDASLAGVTRITKEVKGDVETVTAYGEGGKLVSKHRNPFKLVSQGDVRLWTFTTIEVIEGPQKGYKSPADFSGSYVYRLDGDTLYEAQGLLVADQKKGVTPVLYTWKRVKKTD
jgi:hypothetical protein